MNTNTGLNHPISMCDPFNRPHGDDPEEEIELRNEKIAWLEQVIMAQAYAIGALKMQAELRADRLLTLGMGYAIL